jgi:hypothetical protein
MKNLFIAISSILTVASTVPYLIDILKKKTKPRIVSWFNWSLLTGIACAASFADKQYPSAILTLLACLETATIVVLGLKYGDRKFETFDVFCELGAITGLVLWIIFNAPVVAIIAAVAIDFVASLPTIRHAWQKPAEETVSAFVLAGTAGIFTIFALNKPHVSGIIYPVYIVLINVVISGVLFNRMRAKQV